MLFGAGGLVIGAGVTESANLLTGSGSSGGSDDSAVVAVPSPGEELMTEHGVLKRILLAYRACSDRLAAGADVPAGALLDGAQLVADYVESFHEGLEEAYVFPRLRADSRYAALIETLLVQHDRGRHLTAGILAVAAGDLSARAADVPGPARSARTALKTQLDQFVRMYEPHEAWEDTVVYPALRAATSGRVLNELAERFADEENRQFGDAALARIVQRVAGVEQQLGLADLNTFTPNP